jgi:hypothetical protein
MRSIYEQALGSEFAKLHPQIQKRFGFSSKDGIYALGKGTMSEIWHGPLYTLPFLAVGAWRSIMFPEFGRNVPFSIENFAYVDALGRETVTWIRTFQFKKPRRFDAYMIYSEQRKLIVDYLGTHQHLAVDIDMSVDEKGGLKLKSGDQRFYESAVGFSFPMMFSGIADVCEWYDDDEAKFNIEVKVTNKPWGPLFGYRGKFDVEWLACDQVPANVLPQRTERRE